MPVRQPKGNSTGGQFAEARLPVSGDLVDNYGDGVREKYCGYCQVEGHNFAHCSRRDEDGIAIGVDSDDFHEEFLDPSYGNGDY